MWGVVRGVEGKRRGEQSPARKVRVREAKPLASNVDRVVARPVSMQVGVVGQPGVSCEYPGGISLYRQCLLYLEPAKEGVKWLPLEGPGVLVTFNRFSV